MFTAWRHPVEVIAVPGGMAEVRNRTQAGPGRRHDDASVHVSTVPFGYVWSKGKSERRFVYVQVAFRSEVIKRRN